MTILLIIISVCFALYCAWQYGWGRDLRLAPLWIWLALWSLAIGIAQLRLSIFESPWSAKFWLMLILFFISFVGAHYLIDRRVRSFWQARRQLTCSVDPRLLRGLIGILIGLSILGVGILWQQFGTLPLLSSAPDKLRFIINREAFGLWEYFALLPRLIIPLAIYACLVDALHRRWYVGLLALSFGILLLYASRLVVIMPLIISYAIYIMHRRHVISTRKLLGASAAVVIAVLIFSITIPALRQFITYRDYHQDVEYSPFTYLFDLAQLNIPERLSFVVPIYIIPSFNLQALSHAVERGSSAGEFYGAYGLSVFNPLLKIFHFPIIDVKINWKELYLPWWVTATAIFSAWVDFGWLGIIGAGVLWGGLLAFIYRWAYERASALPLLLYGYLTFVVVMSIYTNYFMRQEFYLDVVLLVIIGFILDKKRSAAD